MKTLVTGGTGFIGNHLIKALVEQGRDVRCLVRETSNTKFLEELKVDLVYGDIGKKDSLKDAVKGVSIVYHLAGEVYSKRSDDFFKVNVNGTKNLIEVCICEKIQKFIYFSSIAAVGPNPHRDIVLNEQSPCKPISPYGKSKYETEKMLILRYHKVNNLPIVIIRLPVVYGPGISPLSRVSLMLKMALSGKIRMVGDGNNTICLCNIENLIQGVLLAERNSKAKGEIYFLADKKPYTINNIIQKVAQKEGVEFSQSRIPVFLAKTVVRIVTISARVFGLSLPFHPHIIEEITHNWVNSISKAENELGYCPKVGLEDSLEATIDWFKSQNIIRGG
ncbi:MAG: NAD-dependent epimerase/dehydratase family protein [Thermodesulfobacteriota bacterium]|nr:NAD-dependent epimerase/dehydratase family protein [Thermodesulfobacteriota bacterium]